MKLGTQRIEAVLARLGHPEAGLAGMLVAGTNGKGSTAAMAASILRASGWRVGFMPKPHLQTYRERIQIGGVPISESDFAAALSAIQPALEDVGRELGPATEFEILTALAVQYLAPRVDRLVCEVGMGGRLDATNALDLGVAVITNVGLDHQQYLGSTIPAIAAEKAAIIKAGNQVVTGAEPPALEVVEAAASATGVTLWRLGKELSLQARDLGWEGSEIDLEGPGFKLHHLRVPLLGRHQSRNAALGAAAAIAAGASVQSVAQGIAETTWPGRLELLGDGPRVLLDGAHNVDGMQAVADTLMSLLGEQRLVVVFGAMADKDLPGMLAILRRLQPAEVFFTRVDEPRAAEAAQLRSLYGSGRVETPPLAALQAALDEAGREGTVVVAGSLYLVGELRSLLLPVAA